MYILMLYKEKGLRTGFSAEAPWNATINIKKSVK